MTLLWLCQYGCGHCKARADPAEAERRRRAEQAAAASAAVPAVAQVPKVPFENLRVEQRSIAEGSFKSVYRATWNHTGDFLAPDLSRDL